MLDSLQTDSGCTSSVLCFSETTNFLYKSHKWEKGSIEESVLLDAIQVTALLNVREWGLEGWATSRRAWKIKQAVHAFQFHTTAALCGLGLGWKCRMERCLVWKSSICTLQVVGRGTFQKCHYCLQAAFKIPPKGCSSSLVQFTLQGKGALRFCKFSSLI